MVGGGCNRVWSDEAAMQTGVGGTIGRGSSSDVSLLGAVISGEMASGLNEKTPVVKFSEALAVSCPPGWGREGQGVSRFTCTCKGQARLINYQAVEA